MGYPTKEHIVGFFQGSYCIYSRIAIMSPGTTEEGEAGLEHVSSESPSL